MIELTNLTYCYGQQTLHFNLSVAAGEQVSLLGPSGAGKSTLLNLIAGFIFPESGMIRLDNRDHTNTPPMQRPVSMLFQENNLFAHLTVAENIGLGLDSGLKLSSEQQRIRTDIMAKSGLSDYANRLPAQLSGGQRQRVALARCLVRHRPILLLDEPFSALDPALRADMLTLVSEMCREQNLTLLMVSHNLDDAAKIATRTLVIDEGTIAYDGSLQTLVNGQARASRIIGIHI